MRVQLQRRFRIFFTPRLVQLAELLDAAQQRPLDSGLSYVVSGFDATKKVSLSVQDKTLAEVLDILAVKADFTASSTGTRS